MDPTSGLTGRFGFGFGKHESMRLDTRAAGRDTRARLTTSVDTPLARRIGQAAEMSRRGKWALNEFRNREAIAQEEATREARAKIAPLLRVLARPESSAVQRHNAAVLLALARPWSGDRRDRYFENFRADVSSCLSIEKSGSGELVVLFRSLKQQETAKSGFPDDANLLKHIKVMLAEVEFALKDRPRATAIAQSLPFAGTASALATATKPGQPGEAARERRIQDKASAIRSYLNAAQSAVATVDYRRVPNPPRLVQLVIDLSLHVGPISRCKLDAHEAKAVNLATANVHKRLSRLTDTELIALGTEELLRLEPACRLLKFTDVADRIYSE